MQNMFDAFDGYAINVEVDFEEPREGQVVCIQEILPEDEEAGIPSKPKFIANSEKTTADL